jgi:hypothetical protein
VATDSVTVSPTFNGDSVSLTAGMIVRLKPGANNTVVRAQADSAPHVQGVNGVVVSGAAAPGGILTVACIGRATVQLASGLTPSVGDTVYVSPTVPGKGTNVQPGVIATIGSIADISNYVASGTVEVDVAIGDQGTAGATGPQGPQGATGVQGFQGAGGSQGAQGATGLQGATGTQGFQGATGVQGAQGIQGSSVASGDPRTSVVTVAGVATVSRNSEAFWTYNPAFGGGVRYFACDGALGSDANAGFSDASQAAAGLVAVQTLTRLLQILPLFGNGRACRVAIKAGTYNNAADTQITLSGFGFENASFNSLVIIGTATVPSAGSTAFQGDLNDSVCAGFQNATGMNAAGYNATAYSAAGGIVTMTAQLNGGGAPGFGAMPARPYGCRIRFDVATATVALQNQMSGVIRVDSGTSFVLSSQLPATPAAGDVFYIEMPGVSGPAQTFMSHFGDGGTGFTGTQLCGINFGALEISDSALALVGCEAGTVVSTNSILTEADALLDNAAGGFDSRSRGISLRCSAKTLNGGENIVVSEATTSTTAPSNLWKSTTNVLWERSGAGTQPIAYGTQQTTGNNNVNQIGTNSSTVHGSPCQIWGTCAAPSGTLRAGLVVYGSFTLGRINFQNIGANPCTRHGGTGLAINGNSGLTGSTGNTDVGLDLSPSGISGNSIGAMGCTVALTGTPTVTGTTGDVRLSDGTLVSWATALAGLIDANGNQLFGAGNAPLGTKVASAATAVALGNVAPGTVTSSTPTVWTPVVIGGVKYLMPLWPST